MTSAVMAAAYLSTDECRILSYWRAIVLGCARHIQLYCFNDRTMVMSAHGCIPYDVVEVGYWGYM